MTKIERLGDRLKKSFRRLSRSVTPEPPYDPHSHPEPLLNNPPPNAASSAPSSVSNAVAGASLLAISTIAAPQPTMAGKASPLGGIPQKTVFQDDGSSPMPFADISPNAHSVTVASVDHTAWPGLKLLAGVLNTSTDIFGPLKQAVDAFVECTKTYAEVRILVISLTK
ncbi:hypothetical protein FRC12_008526 [Ceratobasidium sp. 428]|nr:hypothetical protein FRC12_008526 [Ceratobasidium sp. 428]